MTATPQVEATAPAARAPRFMGLEGVRAIGVVAVFLTHASFATGTTKGIHGFSVVGRRISAGSLLGHLEIGPAIFFMISAFLLYLPFVRASFSGEPRPSLTRFLRRRFVRVFPAYWITLALLLLFDRIHPDGLFHTLRLFTLTHIYTTHSFFAIDVLVPTWTLATELTFYAFLVLYAPLMRRFNGGRTAKAALLNELCAVAALCIFAFAWRALVYRGIGLPSVAEHWLPGTIDLFAVGLGLAAIRAYISIDNPVPRIIERVSAHPNLCALTAIGCYLAVPVLLNVSDGTEYSTGLDAYLRNWFQLLCALFLLLPVAFGTPTEGLYRRFLSLPAVAYVGLVSYGIYLWHVEWIVRAIEWSGGIVAFHASFWLVVVTGFALSLASGALSFTLLERPLLDLDARVHLASAKRRP